MPHQNRKGIYGTSTYTRLKKEHLLKNQIQTKLYFCLDNVNLYVKGNKENWVLDWPFVPTTWRTKISTNLSSQEVLTLKYIGSQLQQREAPPHQLFMSISNIPNLQILWLQFLSSTKSKCTQLHLILKVFLLKCKYTHYGPRIKWESTSIMNGCYITESWQSHTRCVKPLLPCLKLREDQSCVNQQSSTMHLARLHKNEFQIFGKERKVDVLQTPLLYFWISLQVEPHDKHIHSCLNLQL